MKDSEDLGRCLHLISYFLACSAGRRALLWAGLPLAAVLWAQWKWPKVFFACARRTVGMTRARAAGVEWGQLIWHCLLFSIPFCAVHVSGWDNSSHAVLNWEVQLEVKFLFNRNELDERLKKAWWWQKIKQNYQWRWCQNVIEGSDSIEELEIKWSAYIENG